MTQEQIINEAKKEMMDFNNKIYDGLPLPDDIFEKLEKGLFVAGFQDVELTKRLLGRDFETITWEETGMVINFIKGISPRELFDSLEETLEYRERLDEITRYYNKVSYEVQREINEKRDRKLKLSGHTKTAVFAK